jgi:hypothetical protein
VKHFEHSLGDKESPGDVYGCNEDGYATEQGITSGDKQHAPNDDYTADGVGDTHEWCVQGGGYVPDDHITKKAGQDKDTNLMQENSICRTFPSKSKEREAGQPKKESRL